MTKTVEVGGKHYDITIGQRRRTIWFAVGDFLGSRLMVEGGSRAGVIKKWKAAADHKLRTS